MKGVLIPTDGAPRPIDIQKDSDSSVLSSLQRLVGGNIEAFPVIFGDNICVYVNEEGLYNCPPNRAVYATHGMEEAGYISQIDYSHTVKEGELYTVLFGDLVAVGYDPDTTDVHDILTDEQIAHIEEWADALSAKDVLPKAAFVAHDPTYKKPHDEPVSLADEAKASRSASEALADEVGVDIPQHDSYAIE